MEQKVKKFIFLLSFQDKKAQLVNTLRSITKNPTFADIKPLIDLPQISNEEIFDEIFLNKVCRNYEIIKYIVSKKLPFTTNQLKTISKTRFVQNDKRLREKFEKINNFKVEDKRYSINKLNKLTRERRLAISDTPVNRTIKIGVNIHKVDIQSKHWLDEYLNEWECLRKRVLEDIYNIFKSNETEILVRACDVSYSEKHIESKLNFSKEALKEGDAVKTFPIRGSNQLKYKLYRISYKNKKGDKKERIEYVADNGVNCLKLKKEEGGFRISKFSSQDLYNNLISPKYFSIKPSKKYSSKFYRGLKVSELTKNINSNSVRETLGASVASTVCSFIDKYYNSIGEINSKHKLNKKTFIKNYQYVTKNVFDYPDKPKQNNTEVTRYNAFITTYNQYINENVWQKSDDKDIKEKVKKLQIIKDIPSFPIIEKQETRDYEKILREMIDTYKNVKSHVDKIDFSKIDQIDLADWLGRKSARAGREIKYFFDKTEKKKNLTRNDYKQLAISSKDSIEIWKELVIFLDSKIKQIKIDLSTPKKARIVGDLYAQYVSIASELLYDKSTAEYADFRIRFNTLTALLKANPFEELKQEKSEISFSGFSSDGIRLKKGFALCFKESKGKLQFYVLFNLKQDIKLAFSNEGEFKAIAYIGSGEKQTAVIKPLSYEQKEGTCLLPLAFGKRIGRKYFYNNSIKSDTNSLKYLESLLVKFSNVRIVKEIVNTSKGKQARYYCAIALEKKFPRFIRNKDSLKNVKSVIGIDMGEKIPAVAALIDSKTNKIKSVWDLRADMNEKLRSIQNRKDEAQRRMGIIPPNLNTRIKNFTQKLLEDVAIQSLELSIRNTAIIATEDLSRGFGRGASKGTYVWMRQYTKLNDILASKAKELGITNLKNEKDYSNKGKTYIYSPRGYLVKVPASYTSKTSIQTGFILRSPNKFTIEEDDICNLSKLNIRDKELGVKINFDLDTKTLDIAWREGHTIKPFSGKARELGKFYDEVVTKERFEKLMNNIFNNRKSNSKERKEQIKKFVYNLLNPRREQAVYTDILTRKSVNADAQGAINVARSYLFSLSKEYADYKKIKDKGKKDQSSKSGFGFLKAWQNWYTNNLTILPNFLYINSNDQAQAA